MRKPRRISRKKSRRMFRRGAGINSKNAPRTIHRGGIRL